jgi:hypothetical protein
MHVVPAVFKDRKMKLFSSYTHTFDAPIVSISVDRSVHFTLQKKINALVKEKKNSLNLEFIIVH